MSNETLDFCKQNPNKQRLLSKSDLREIKRYVNSIKAGNNLCVIRRVREKLKDQDEEVVNVNGTISTSKYSFVG